MQGRLPPSPCALPSLHPARSSHRAIAAPLLRSSHLRASAAAIQNVSSEKRSSMVRCHRHRPRSRGRSHTTPRRPGGTQQARRAQWRREEQRRRKRRVDVRHVRRRTMAGWPPTSVTKSTQLEPFKCATSRCSRAPQRKSTRCTRRCAPRSCATRLRRARAPQGDRHVRHMQNFRFSPINGQETAATGH